MKSELGENQLRDNQLSDGVIVEQELRTHPGTFVLLQGSALPDLLYHLPQSSIATSVI